jgi:cell division protein FtsL
LATAQPTEIRIRRYAEGIRSFVLTLLFVAVLSSLGIYQVWQRFEVYVLGLQLSTETLQYRSALEDGRKLKLELATIKRAGVIRQQAADRLDMRVPPPQDIVEIR